MFVLRKSNVKTVSRLHISVCNSSIKDIYILNQKRNFRKVGLKLIRLNTTCRKMCICSSLHWRPTLRNRSDNHLMSNDIVCFDKTSIFTCTHGVDISGLHVLTFFHCKLLHLTTTVIKIPKHFYIDIIWAKFRCLELRNI